MGDDQTRREDIRYAVRDYLAARPTIAQSVPTIRRRIEVEASGNEVKAALEFWQSLEPPQVSYEYSTAGSTQYWKITAAGTLAHERGQ